MSWLELAADILKRCDQPRAAIPWLERLIDKAPGNKVYWLELSVAYAAERKQFGQQIREFEAIQFKLADMATRIAAARALLYAAATAKDRGAAITQFSAMSKLMASETAMWVTTQAIQIFGGYGYVKEYPVERLFRDAKVTEIYEGTSEIQRIVIARHIL